MPRTSHAARVCEPKNRDARPSLCGLFRTRITVNVMIPASTPTLNRSSMKPMAGQWPIPGIANVRLNRSPYASMMRQQQHDEAPEGRRRAPRRAPTT